MRMTLAALAAQVLAGAAYAQTTESAPPSAPAECPAMPEPPATPDPARASVQSMGAASRALAAWREQARAVHECRRQQFNAVVGQMNEVEQRWGAALDAFCSRRNVRCESMQREQPAN